MSRRILSVISSSSLTSQTSAEHYLCHRLAATSVPAEYRQIMSYTAYHNVDNPDLEALATTAAASSALCRLMCVCLIN